MLYKSRTHRMGLLRRTLNVESLEDRTLPSGVVTAVLHADTGVLQILGDAGDNQFTIAPAPTPGQIRVAGNPGTATSINGADFADFPLSSVTDIAMILGSGLDNVTVTGFNISGALTILYGNGADVFSTLDFNAASIAMTGPSLGLGSGNNNGLVPPVGTLSSGGNGGQSPPNGGGSGGAGSVLGSGDNSGLLPPLQGFGTGSDNNGDLVPPLV